MSLTATGDIAYKMKKALPDGTSTLVLTPTDFIRRVASLVPAPRRHLVKFFGVLAPHARDRAAVVPEPDPPLVVPSPPENTVKASIEKAPPRPLRPGRILWGELLRRVFAIDVFSCDRCGGRRRILSAITEPAVARRILGHVDLPTSVPVVLPARAPPDAQLGFPESQIDFYVDPPCGTCQRFETADS